LIRVVGPLQLQQTLERLRYYALSAIDVQGDVRRTKLTFVSTVDREEDISIELFELLFIRISRTPDDDPPYMVGEIKISALSANEEKRLLTTLGYSFREDDTNAIPSFGKQLFHFTLEGSICLDIVCEDCLVRSSTP
jgi:hypothetical protein